MQRQPAVVVQGLEKTYPGGTRAIDGIDFTVEQGEFFGFLGPNGAGKTTTIKILATLLSKSAGHVEVAGIDIDADARSVRASIGVALQEVGLDDLSKGRDFLVLQGRLYGIGRAEANRRADELLELVGLSGVGKRKIGSYSGGMRRRIDLAGALMHRPNILFLDEPTSGLDPQSRLAIWEHLEQLNAQGVTIMLTTQHMDEADRLCRRLAIIDHGRLVTEGSPERAQGRRRRRRRARLLRPHGLPRRPRRHRARRPASTPLGAGSRHHARRADGHGRRRRRRRAPRSCAPSTTPKSPWPTSPSPAHRSTTSSCITRDARFARPTPMRTPSRASGASGWA